MINHLENYNKLSSPNDKMLALRKARKAIDEEAHKLLSECVRCRCGYLMTNDEFSRKRQIYTNPNYRDVSWTDCPVCGQMIFG